MQRRDWADTLVQSVVDTNTKEIQAKAEQNLDKASKEKVNMVFQVTAALTWRAPAGKMYQNIKKSEEDIKSSLRLLFLRSKLLESCGFSFSSSSFSLGFFSQPKISSIMRAGGRSVLPN